MHTHRHDPDASTEVNRSGKRPSRRTFLKAAGATGTAALAGCVGGLGGGGGPITFGGIYLLSGFASVYGESAQLGIEMAREEINEDGGIDGRDVDEVIFRDSEGSPETGVQHARSLVEEENVDALIGLDSSGVSLQVAPVMEQLQKTLLITHAATPFVTNPPDGWDGPDDRAVGNDYVFRDGVNLAQNVYGAASVAADLDATTWTTVGPDYAFGHQTWDYFKAYTDGMDLEFEHDDDAAAYPQLGASDFSPQINKVTNASPDGVIMSIWGGDLITFLDQAADTDFFDSVDHVLMTVGAATDVLRPMGEDMPDGLWAGTRYWFLSPDSEENQTFYDTFQDRYDRPPSYNAQNAYTGMYLYRRAIEDAGSVEPDDIISALEGIQHTGPVGEFTIDEQSHQAGLPAVWGQTSYDSELGISVLDPVERIETPADELRSLLSGTDLPAGV